MLTALQTFGEWLDTPAGGDWFQAGLMLGILVFSILKGARRNG